MIIILNLLSDNRKKYTLYSFFYTLITSVKNVFYFYNLGKSYMSDHIIIEQSPLLQGEIILDGAKNAVLVIMASLILTRGKSHLTNVPCSNDVYQMIALLQNLGATVYFDEKNNTADIDTSTICAQAVNADIMKKMRASILVMGPLLARYGAAEIALPGGCVIGARPVDYHLKAFAKMGAVITHTQDALYARAEKLTPQRFMLEYPSVGATENIMMAAALTPGKTTIINAALEPEVFDLIAVLRKMGAHITITQPAAIVIEGVEDLKPVTHAIMADRLEAGTLLLAVAMTGGSVTIPHIHVDMLELVLEKLDEMGHVIGIGPDGMGISFSATANPRAVSFKTMPYPGFPTDLQAPMMAVLCRASGESVIHETVYENRLLHIRELQKMGAQITQSGTMAVIKGVDELYGASVIATDIRASAALVIAGLGAHGQTVMSGVHHLRRGYNKLEDKIMKLGGKIRVG